MRLWKSYICSNKLDVQETNLGFTQFNRIRNHLSLDTGLRLDGLLGLELWDLIVSVFGNISHVSDRTGQLVNWKNESFNKIDVLHDVDSVPSIGQSASREALLYVFEDNEAVIKNDYERQKSNNETCFPNS